MGVATTAGATALTRIPYWASSMARFRVSVQAALGHRVPEDRVAAMAWWAPMLPMLTMDPPWPCATMPRATVWVRKKTARSSSR